MKEIKVMAWNIESLKTKVKRLAIQTIIQNSLADIFVLSEFPNNQDGLNLLESLSKDYSYILPTGKKTYRKNKSSFPIDVGQKIKVGYVVPPKIDTIIEPKERLWMITIVLIRKGNNILQDVKIEDVKVAHSEGKELTMDTPYRWLEIKGVLWGEDISIIGVHIKQYPKGMNYWNYLQSHLQISGIDRKVIIIGDMNVSTEKNACQTAFENLKSISNLEDLAELDKNMSRTFKWGTRIDYVLLSKTFFDENVEVEYLYDEGGMGFSNSDHVNIGVTIKRND
ncbi:endonuclease/exonuclease/phosphatase family protein [Psychrobacillus sp. FSL H8-0484]|uniref:endonuclease/exonuclease/phosphatase family protein n=1 Tax=Psychrobacillus sp. FSL H8-0484 TaxID=2921390 RepID=UPI0030FB837B